ADRLEDLREACTPAACVELHGVVRRKRVQLGMQQQEVRIETVQRRVGVEQFLHRLSERGRMTGGDQAAASEIRLDELGQRLEYDRACERDTRLSPSVRSAQRSTHTAHVDTVERQRIRRAQLLEQIAHRAWSNLVDQRTRNTGRAGLPCATQRAGTLLATTEPAETIVSSPTLAPSRTSAAVASHAPAPM